uniref:limulus clotting factor C n=1 Tax=Graphocephala atropunctata TaxID=36148 RepID=A0A1B6KI46_9HEMI
MFLSNIQHVYAYWGMSVLFLSFGTASSHQLRKDLTSHPNWKLLDRGDDCGHNVADRIIGGDEATLGQYPWIARLGYTYELDESNSVDTYECGGTIINSLYILTAAHCSPDIVMLQLAEVRLGEHNVTSDPDCVDGVCAPPVQDIVVDEYLCHEDYDTKSYQNDICLLRLANPIQFNNYVTPICLPAYDTFLKASFDSSTMEVAGWGVTDIVTGKASTILLTLRVPIKTQFLCELAYSGRSEIINKQMCAGGVIGKDSCSGDSGGPLMAPFALNAPPRYFVVGIVSFGPRQCANTNTPGVYTKVSEYMAWILDNIRE